MTVQQIATWHLRQAIGHWKAARSYTARYDSDVEAFRAIFGVEERTKHADFHLEAHEIIARLARS